MKKIALLTLVSLFCGLVFAAGVPTAPASYKSAFELKAQEPSGMDIFFTLPSFEVGKEVSNGQTFHRIKLPDTGTLMQEGMPELPVITTTIAVPHRGSVFIEVQNAQQSILSQYNAYPLQADNKLGQPRAFAQNADYYRSGTIYPGSVVESSEPMILRDFRIVTIQVNPFAYNAELNELTVYEHIQLRVNFTGETGVNELPGPVQYISPSFDKIYKATIQNYHDYRDLMIAHTPPRYLIIHGNSTDASFHNALDGFAHWKRQKGADVDVFSTAGSQAGSTNSSIQAFIRGRYNNLATRPDYVILVGDVIGSYSIPAFNYVTSATDFPYTHMNTGDAIGDVFLGRISVENISQLQLLFQKIYLYERDIDLATADWLNRMLLVGDPTPGGISAVNVNKYIKEMARQTNPDYTFTEAYEHNFQDMEPSINAAINQGVGFYNYSGYIDFAPPAESALSNGHKLLHVISMAPATNCYSQGESEMERFVRYGSLANPKGAVTAIGNSFHSEHMPNFEQAMQGGIFEGILAQGMRSMGEALMRGRLYMQDVYGVSSQFHVDRYTHWCNLIGDPTMEVFTGIPGSFVIDTNADIPLGITRLDVTVTDATGLIQEGAAVTLSMGQNILSRGYSDAQGKVILDLPDDLAAGQATITVSSHNFKPLQAAIDIVNTPTLLPAGLTINADNSGIITAGETGEIFFGLKNTGLELISGISGLLSSDSPWINILQPELAYPEIVGGATANNLLPVVIEIDAATPPETMLRLHLNLTDSNGISYVIPEFILVEAAQIIFVELSIADDDSQDGILDPNETANLVFTLKNIGAAELDNIYAHLYTENDLISVVGNTSFFGSMALNQLVSSSDTEPFSVWQRPETLPGMVMPMYLRLYNAAGFQQIVHFSLTVGQVSQSDPLGPDSYGYVIYDWTDLAYPEVAEYAWLEIASQAGGMGTPLPISDLHVNYSEGDQTDTQSLAVVDLPFLFQFYGRMYSQITVCSNGFIALGVTENGEFRNYRLPGAMGPSPMIAPFWDDLATDSSSGVYTMFDRSNHAFIIEWYNMKSGRDGSTPETFQVILYDQTAYSSSLGDGPIKIQYHTFNNINSQSGIRHGNYCSIGIKDHAGTRGLEYTFNNHYPTAAAPLSHGKALYITNAPTYHEAANLVIVTTYVDDANNVVEPGETVSLGVLLENTGNLQTDEITATLSTTSEYVNMRSPVSFYYPLGAGETGVNSHPFMFWVSQDCPAGQVIQFALHIEAGARIWDLAFSIRVVSSQLQCHSFLISDYESNFNGVIDPDEAVKLIINLQNASVVDASEVLVTLDSNEPNLSIANPLQTISRIAEGQIRQIVFDLDFTGVTSAAGYLQMHFTASPLSGESADMLLFVPYNMTNSDPNCKPGFVQGQVWLTSTQDPSLATVMSAQHFATNPDSTGAYRLYLANGDHSVTASLAYHQSSTLHNISINETTPVFYADFTLIDLPAVDSFGFSCDNAVGSMELFWSQNFESIFPASAYRVYRKFGSGPFEMVSETAAEFYTEIRELQGWYLYYVTAVYMGEEGAPTNIVDLSWWEVGGNEDPQAPELKTALGRNYPNPSNSTTNISFTLAEPGPASLKIYNAKGQMVRELTNAEYNAGQHHLVWDGRDTQGRAVSSGLYFYRLQAKGFSQSHKMILMK
jgi:hypothetical protein